MAPAPPAKRPGFGSFLHDNSDGYGQDQEAPAGSMAGLSISASRAPAPPPFCRRLRQRVWANVAFDYNPGMPLDYLVSALVTLLVVVDPVGLTPAFLAVTQGLPVAARKRIAFRAC